jgi:hypothetical protein
MNSRIFTLTVTLFVLTGFSLTAQEFDGYYTPFYTDKFRQLKEELPGPNSFRTASGAPGSQYYQQKADYQINVSLNEAEKTIAGTETITYHNNSPDDLDYLWIQLDQNMRALDSDRKKIEQVKMEDRADGSQKMTFGRMKRLRNEFDGGFRIEEVKNASGKDLAHVINQTMMRIDLPEPLKAGNKTQIKIKWWFPINNRMEVGGRSGYEWFEDEDNGIFTIAQFFPRMAVYNEIEGWQNKQFLGRGEFALPFGDYLVNITVPADHIVGATGELQNTSVLTSEQRSRFQKARTSDSPVLIVTEEEARENEKEKSTDMKTWTFKAQNVRDFAFATSRKFIWDAMGVQIGGKTIMAMSYYPKEGNPLWEQYSTEAVAHTIHTYSKYTIDYDYPVAISVHTKWIGMEYPMICFNGGRPEPDGTYSQSTKYGMISVIIHEVGHNFFPMIINSDERHWTWMDEGLNTFVQFLTEQEWEPDYPSRASTIKIVDYMKSDPSRMVPIMTNSESLIQFGQNAYAKTATGLVILRETIMGRELFDFAFKKYAQRWAYKHPTPADFFRTMEDASAVDLDWFWRGWFYSIDYCDIGLKSVSWLQVNDGNPEMARANAETFRFEKPRTLTALRNQEAGMITRVEQNENLLDFYSTYDKYDFDEEDISRFENYRMELDEEQSALLDSELNYYEVEFELVGGLVMPVILNFEFDDGSNEIYRIPAQIWQRKNKTATKLFWFDKPIKGITLDPFYETADVDRNNNYWPHKTEPSSFELYKSKRAYKNRKRGPNPMQEANEKKVTK